MKNVLWHTPQALLHLDRLPWSVLGGTGNGGEEAPRH